MIPAIPIMLKPMAPKLRSPADGVPEAVGALDVLDPEVAPDTDFVVVEAEVDKVDPPVVVTLLISLVRPLTIPETLLSIEETREAAPVI